VNARQRWYLSARVVSDGVEGDLLVEVREEERARAANAGPEAGVRRRVGAEERREGRHRFGDGHVDREAIRRCGDRHLV
jgi:hypothetical protein